MSFRVEIPKYSWQKISINITFPSEFYFNIIRETEEKTVTGQRESGRRLGERITDTTFWRNELSTELERMLAETNLLQDKRRDLEKAIQDTEGPLHIAQECLYQRENRQGLKYQQYMGFSMMFCILLWSVLMTHWQYMTVYTC